MKSIAYGSFALAALLFLGFGVIYISRGEFMPYHAAAVSMSRTDIDPALQRLIISLMKATGGGFLSAGSAILFLLLAPFRRGDRWAGWAIFIVGLLVGIPSLYAGYLVQVHTPGSPPIWAATAGIVLLTVGALSSELRLLRQTNPSTERNSP